MARYNHCIFEGNLGKDPEVKGKMTTFSLAVWQGKDRPTLWLLCKSFEAPIMAKKGQKVRVEGRLYFETYADKENYQRTVWGLIVESCEPLTRAETPIERLPYAPDELDEDVPFSLPSR
jgi:single-stranded DNA-binding protein